MVQGRLTDSTGLSISDASSVIDNALQLSGIPKEIVDGSLTDFILEQEWSWWWDHNEPVLSTIRDMLLSGF